MKMKLNSMRCALQNNPWPSKCLPWEYVYCTPKQLTNQSQYEAQQRIYSSLSRPLLFFYYRSIAILRVIHCHVILEANNSPLLCCGAVCDMLQCEFRVNWELIQHGSGRYVNKWPLRVSCSSSAIGFDSGVLHVNATDECCTYLI